MRKVLVIFFLFFMISPSVGWLTGITASRVTGEKRALAKLPDVSLKGLSDKDYLPKFDRYFNDHFAFRGPLVKAKNWADYHIFHSSPTPKVVLGKDGWLFASKGIKDYVKNDCDESDKIWDIARGLHNQERVLEQTGQTFVFIIAPNKATIYPEMLGLKRAKSGCAKSRYEILMDAFKLYPVRGFIRLDKLFMEAKKDGPLYYKTGTHWNIRAEKIAMEALLQYLSPDEWETYMPKVDIKDTFRVGDISSMMGLNIGEDTVSASFTYSNVIKHEELKSFSYDPNKSARQRFTSSTAPGYRRLPRAVLFHDSFMSDPIKIIQGSFERLDTFWSYQLLLNDAALDLKESRIVIYEMVERNLHYLYRENQ